MSISGTVSLQRINENAMVGNYCKRPLEEEEKAQPDANATNDEPSFVVADTSAVVTPERPAKKKKSRVAGGCDDGDYDEHDDGRKPAAFQRCHQQNYGEED